PDLTGVGGLTPHQGTLPQHGVAMSPDFFRNPLTTDVVDSRHDLKTVKRRVRKSPKYQLTHGSGCDSATVSTRAHPVSKIRNAHAAVDLIDAATSKVPPCVVDDGEVVHRSLSMTVECRLNPRRSVGFGVALVAPWHPGRNVSHGLQHGNRHLGSIFELVRPNVHGAHSVRLLNVSDSSGAV